MRTRCRSVRRAGCRVAGTGRQRRRIESHLRPIARQHRSGAQRGRHLHARGGKIAIRREAGQHLLPLQQRFGKPVQLSVAYLSADGAATQCLRRPDGNCHSFEDFQASELAKQYEVTVG